jgi:hypothetical protein
MLNVVESESGGKTYSNIAGIGSMPRGVPSPAAENPLLYFDSESSAEDLETLPKWLREKIEGQLRPSKPAANESHAGSDDFRDDDIPF